MRPLGLHAPRYHDFRILDASSHFQDIVHQNPGKVHVHCWPSSEYRGREWGKIDEVNVAVMPFRMSVKASEGHKVDRFEIDITFSLAIQAPTSTTQLREYDKSTQMRPRQDVHLLDFPCPSLVKGSSNIGSGKHAHKPWMLQSEAVTDTEDGRTRTARWIWEANDHEPVILHGAVAVNHPGEQFGLACRVRGKAHKRLKVNRYSFHNEKPIWWHLTPQEPDDALDFKALIKGLDKEMIRLNTDDIEFLRANAAGSPLAAQTSRHPRRNTSGVLVGGLSPQDLTVNALGSHSYGASTVLGQGHVHQGDLVNNYNMTFGFAAGPNRADVVREVASPIVAIRDIQNIDIDAMASDGLASR